MYQKRLRNRLFPNYLNEVPEIGNREFITAEVFKNSCHFKIRCKGEELKWGEKILPLKALPLAGVEEAPGRGAEPGAALPPRPPALPPRSSALPAPGQQPPLGQQEKAPFICP